MQRKLTITIDAQIYDDLHNIVGRNRISQFIESLVRPHIVRENAYREMGQDEAREIEAFEWTEATS